MVDVIVLFAVLFIGAIMAVVSALILDYTIEYIQVFRAKTVPNLRGHSERLGRKCYSLYSKRQKTWYILWAGLMIIGWGSVTVGFHFGIRAIIEKEPSMAIWYWPIMLFAVILAVGICVSKMKTALSLQE